MGWLKICITDNLKINANLYSVMQSDGNSFIGDVKQGWRQYLDQKYEKQIFCALYYEDFKFLEGLKKMHMERNTAQQQENWVLVLLFY